MKCNLDFNIDPVMYERMITSWNKFTYRMTEAAKEMSFEINKMNKALQHYNKDNNIEEVTITTRPIDFKVEADMVEREGFTINLNQTYSTDLKVIDLLKMFADNVTLPKKIRYNGKEWTNCSRTQKYLLYYCDITEQIFKLEMFNTPPGMTDQDMLNMSIEVLEW